MSSMLAGGKEGGRFGKILKVLPPLLNPLDQSPLSAP